VNEDPFFSFVCKKMADDAAARWAATLAEARRQLRARKQEADPATWWDVAEGAPSPLPPGLLPASAARDAGAPPSTPTPTPPTPTTAPWRQEEWHIAFAILFYEAPPGAWAGGDDLLFFVLADAWAGSGPAGFGGGGGGGRPTTTAPSPLLVRRRGPAPPAGLGLGGAAARTVDWAASVALNLAAQGGYRLGLAVAKRAALAGLGLPAALAASAAAAAAKAGGGASAAPVAASSGVRTAGAVVVEHAVHATPMRVAVEVGGGGSGNGNAGGGGRTVGGVAGPPPPPSREPEVSYPDVCFEVGAGEGRGGGGGGGDASSPTAPPLILSHPGDAFAVFLISHEHRGSGATAATPPTTPPPHTELFAGFVTYEQLAGALCGPGRAGAAAAATAATPLTSLTSLLFGGGAAGRRRSAAAPPPPEHVRMRGPGGAGCADVAVTVLPPGGAGAGAGMAPADPPPAPGGLGGLLARAAAAALGGPPPGPPPVAGPPRFACSLFRLSLPVGELSARLCAEGGAAGET